MKPGKQAVMGGAPGRRVLGLAGLERQWLELAAEGLSQSGKKRGLRVLAW